MPNFVGRNKTFRKEVVLENLVNPLSAALVDFLATDDFDVLGVSKDNVTKLFKHVVNVKPVFTGGFHINITTIVFRKPNGKQTRVILKRVKTARSVRSNTVRIDGSNAGNNERLVDIYTATDGVTDFKK